MENIELYELYHDLYLGCLIVCIVLAAIAVIVFLRLDIRNVIGYLSGRTAKRQIQKIEEESAVSGRLYRKNRRMQQYKQEQQSGADVNPAAASPGARKVDHAVQSAYSAEIASRRDTEEMRRGTQLKPQENQNGGWQDNQSQRSGTEPREAAETAAPENTEVDRTVSPDYIGATETTVLTDTGTEDTSLLQGDMGQTLPDGTEDASLLQDVTEQMIPDKAAASAPDRQSDLSLRGDTEKIMGKPFEEEEETLYGFPVRRKTAGTFKIEREIVMIHSKEII